MNIRQIVAIVFLALAKITGVLSAVTIISSVFYENLRSTASTLVIFACVFLISCVALCFIDIALTNKERKNDIEKIMGDPEAIEILKHKLKNL